MNYENLEGYELHPEIAHEFEYEMHETELAHELLNMEGEAELNHFLGNLVKSAWSGAKALYNSPAGQALKGQLVSGAKALGRQALPALGRAVGGYFGGGTGAQLGNRFGNWAAGRFLNEYETGSGPASQDLALARGIIRMTRQAAMQIAAQSQAGRPLNRRLVRSIIFRNARQQFPNLRFPAGRPPVGGPMQQPANIGSGFQAQGNFQTGFGAGGGSLGQPNTGTWYRQGNQLIVSGV